MTQRELPIAQLGYVGFQVNDLVAWRRFATDLGMQVVDAPPDALRMRMDERPYRMFAVQGPLDRLACIGLEAANEQTLAQLVRQVQGSSAGVHMASDDECRARQVAVMAHLRDPDGHAIELFHGMGPTPLPFEPSRAMGGFRTGDLGLGHVVLQTPRIEAMSAFYESLGFRLSDYMDTPIQARFMHTNARHHSLALIQAPEAKIHHVMVEYVQLDDIGRLYDVALTEPDRIISTLGRHANDHMLSFYSRTPSGFMIETGWAGRLIDVDHWEQQRIATPSIWGHERKWLPEAARQAIRQEMNHLATQGVHAPVEVVNSPGFHLRKPA
jgi:2,3-dihydroxybiphenyl 1,2-dioxygenase